MVDHRPEVGQSETSLDTPCLCLDLDKFTDNARQFAAMCRAKNKLWRPHAKGHKSTEIARRLTALGACGATCAKLGEAEVLAAGGVHDLLIANQLVGPIKLARLMALCRVADPIVTVDHPQQVDDLAAAARAAGVTPRVVVEVNLGLDRAGVEPGPAVTALAERVELAAALRFVGLLGYEGHLMQVEPGEEKASRIRQALALLSGEADRLTRRGWPCPIVSAGGTGSSLTALDCSGITELQSGGVVFMDNFYRENCHIEEFEFALTLWTSVVSRPAPRRAILDAGRKSQHIDLCAPRFLDFPQLRITQLSAEHCRVEWDGPDDLLQLGQKLRLVPGYADFTTVLHDEFVVTQREQVKAVWPLEARGKLQ